jgi:hypothetical protein
MSRSEKDLSWDLWMARREIKRHGGKDPRGYAARRYQHLRCHPWSNDNRAEWANRVEAFQRIMKGSEHYA